MDVLRFPPIDQPTLSADHVPATGQLVQPIVVKGVPIRVFSAATAARLSDEPIDFSGYNAAHVEVIVSGILPSATVSLEGDASGGLQTIALPDPNASQALITANTAFDCLVGAAFVRVRLADVSGTFTADQGFSVIVTPFAAGGQPQIDARLRVGAGTVSTSNPIPISDVGSTSTNNTIELRAVLDEILVELRQIRRGMELLTEEALE